MDKQDRMIRSKQAHPSSRNPKGNQARKEAHQKAEKDGKVRQRG